MSRKKILNPLTNRQVTVGGTVHKNLINMGVMHDGRGSRTRGWRVAAPKRGRERTELLNKCGEKCFLLPKAKKFPVCPVCKNSICTCKYDCRGIIAAKVRASQYGYTDVRKRAQLLGDKYCRK